MSKLQNEVFQIALSKGKRGLAVAIRDGKFTHIQLLGLKHKL